MPPLTDNSTNSAAAIEPRLNGSAPSSLRLTNASRAGSAKSQSTWSPRDQVPLVVPVGFDEDPAVVHSQKSTPDATAEVAAPPSPFEDFDLEVVRPGKPQGVRGPRPTPVAKIPLAAVPLPVPTPTAMVAAEADEATYAQEDVVEQRSPTPSYNVGEAPRPRATPIEAAHPVQPRWNAPPAAQPTPTPSANASDAGKHHCSHPDKCPCPGPTCATQTDLVWIHNVTTVAVGPVPQQAQPTSVCETVQQTSVYWETQQGVWLTTVFPVMNTYWVWEKVPHTVQSLSTAFTETLIPSPTACPLPPGDWCQDGWINGTWHGDGDAPCWFPPPHHGPHWPHPHDIFGRLGPDQIATLVAIPIMLAVVLVLWSIQVLSTIFLLPFQLFTNFVHEFSHVLAGVIGGAKICSVTIDPGCGPLSTMRNGTPSITLLAGYAGSLIFGWGIVTCAFDEKASKITYIITAPIWLPAAWFTVGFWPKLQIAIVIGWSIALWYIWQGRLLRFYMLLLGLLSVLYVLWDCLDDFIYHKQNESDASLLSRLYPSVTPGTWFFIFLVISLGVLACACVSGLHWFQGPRHVYSENFLPT